jgi:uncharacterized protein YbjT (DUF2867 family)
MSKLLVVFGATGNQGGSIAHTVLDDSNLSQEYKVRGITRNASHSATEALKKKGAEIVEADMDTLSTLKPALDGAHTVFLTTNTQYSGNTREIESRQAKATADAAVAAGAKYIIWSSMVNVSKMSHGKLKNAAHFDVKEEVEEYIRSLPVKSAFYVPGCFMSNFHATMRPRPSPSGDGTFVWANPFAPDTEIPLIDITDTGKFIAPILENPDAYDGKALYCATQCRSVTDIVEALSKAAGKTVKHQQVSDEVFKGWLPETMRDALSDMYAHVRDDLYFGPNQKQEVEDSVRRAKGKLTTFEEFLEKNPLTLE